MTDWICLPSGEFLDLTKLVSVHREDDTVICHRPDGLTQEYTGDDADTIAGALAARASVNARAFRAAEQRLDALETMGERAKQMADSAFGQNPFKNPFRASAK